VPQFDPGNSVSPSDNAPQPAPRGRAETRQRLLAAALEVFAEEGFGRSTVEQICERAGFTRGAFYSNFGSLDELFLTMWGERSQQLLADLRQLLNERETPAVQTLREAVDHILPAVPVDEAWYRITAEFTAHALRTPGLREMMAAREEAIIATIMPILDTLLGRIGRRIPDRRTLGLALVAAHDGTTVQCLLEPADPAVWERRAALMTAIVDAYTEEDPD
jgi:AcrR family transcriptional regulator